MTMPPPFIQGGSLGSIAETLEEEGEEGEREFSARLAVGRRAEAQTRQMGQMTTGGVAVEDL
jgi:hypothetical protein